MRKKILIIILLIVLLIAVLYNAQRFFAGTKNSIAPRLQETYSRAKEDDAQSQYLLGYALLNQPGSTKADKEKGFAWLEKAAKQNIAPAKYQLGLAYKKGLGTKQDLTKALEYLLSSYESVPEAAQDIADVYSLMGDEDKAFEWFSKAAQDGSLLSLKKVADKACFSSPQRPRECLERAQYLAKENDVKYAFFLAENYLTGELMGEKSNEKAFYWFLKSANLGNADAMLKLGNSYISGAFTEKNSAKASYWLNRAADADREEEALEISHSIRNSSPFTQKRPDYAAFLTQNEDLAPFYEPLSFSKTMSGYIFTFPKSYDSIKKFLRLYNATPTKKTKTIFSYQALGLVVLDKGKEPLCKFSLFAKGARSIVPASGFNGNTAQLYEFIAPQELTVFTGSFNIKGVFNKEIQKQDRLVITDAWKEFAAVPNCTVKIGTLNVYFKQNNLISRANNTLLQYTAQMPAATVIIFHNGKQESFVITDLFDPAEMFNRSAKSKVRTSFYAASQKTTKF